MARGPGVDNEARWRILPVFRNRRPEAELKRVNLLRVTVAALVLALLASCGKQEEAKVDKSADKAAAELKAKAEADAKAAAAAAELRRKRRKHGRSRSRPMSTATRWSRWR